MPFSTCRPGSSSVRAAYVFLLRKICVARVRATSEIRHKALKETVANLHSPFYSKYSFIH